VPSALEFLVRRQDLVRIRFARAAVPDGSELRPSEVLLGIAEGGRLMVSVISGSAA
jgi:hypothetical protein